MIRKALFPGSFDPITLGHVDIVNRALPLFDEIIIAIGVNSQKRSLFPLEKRMEWIEEVFHFEEKVTVSHFEGLTANFCKSKNVRHIIRGLRNTRDFDFEQTIAQLNRQLNDSLDTLFWVSEPQHSHISSTIVREILQHGGDASAFLPGKLSKKIHDYLAD